MPVVNVYVYIFTSTFLIFVCSLLLIMCFYKIKGCKASNSRLSLLFYVHNADCILNYQSMR